MEESRRSQVSLVFGLRYQETCLDRNQRHRVVEAGGCVLSEAVIFCPKASQKHSWMQVREAPVDGGDS